MKKILVLLFVSINLFSQKIDFKTGTDKLSEPNSWSKLVEFDNGETSFLMAHESARFIQIKTYNADHSIKYDAELHFANVDNKDPLYVLAVYKISNQIVLFLNISKEEEIQIRRVIVDPATGKVIKDEIIDTMPVKRKRLKFIINYPYTVVKKAEESDDYSLISIYKTEEETHKLVIKNFDATHVQTTFFKGAYGFEFDRMEFSGSYVDGAGNAYFILNNILPDAGKDRAHLVLFRLKKTSKQLEQISIKQKNIYTGASCHFTRDEKNFAINIWVNYINTIEGWTTTKSNTFLLKLNATAFTLGPDIRIKNEKIFDIEKRTVPLTDKDKVEFVEYPQFAFTDKDGKNYVFFQRFKTNCKEVCTTSIYDIALYNLSAEGKIDSVAIVPLNFFIPYISNDEKDYSFRNTDWERGKSGLFVNIPTAVNQMGLMSVKYLDYMITPEGKKYVIHNDLPGNISKKAGEKAEEYKKANDGDACLLEINSNYEVSKNFIFGSPEGRKNKYMCILTSDYNYKTKTFVSVYVDKENGDAHLIWVKL